MNKAWLQLRVVNFQWYITDTNGIYCESTKALLSELPRNVCQ